jgi:ribosomal protein S18 acetylase RimI-like enzyme
MMQMHYRPACPDDAAAIARGIVLASDGMVEFLVGEVVPADTALPDLFVPEVLQGQGTLSYQNADVAEFDGSIAGMTLSFPSEQHTITPEMTAFIPRDRLAALEAFFAVRIPQSWYVDTLWVEPTFRRQGIGSALLHQAQKRAIAHHCQALVLMAWANKTDVLQFYQSQGFTLQKHIFVGQHPQMPHPGGFVLLRRDLPQPTQAP